MVRRFYGFGDAPVWDFGGAGMLVVMDLERRLGGGSRDFQVVLVQAGASDRLQCGAGISGAARAVEEM